MQSTRFVVTSTSSTASLPSVSTEATSKPTNARSWASFFASTGTRTYSDSQERGIFIASSRELRQEAQVALVEEPDVVDAVPDHGHALDPDPEREAGHDLGIVDLAAEALVH